MDEFSWFSVELSPEWYRWESKRDTATIALDDCVIQAATADAHPFH